MDLSWVSMEFTILPIILFECILPSSVPLLLFSFIIDVIIEVISIELREMDMG